MKYDPKIISRNIKSLMGEESNYSLSHKTGISESALSRGLRGTTFTIDILLKIAEHYGVSKVLTQTMRSTKSNSTPLITVNCAVWISEVNSGTYNMPQILLLIDRVYRDFNFTDLNGTCKVGDGIKAEEEKPVEVTAIPIKKKEVIELDKYIDF